MAYELFVTYTGEYVEARSTGDKSYQTAVALWQEVTRVCAESDCFRVLGIGRSTTSMPVMDSLNHEQLFKDFNVNHRYKVAWVELNPDAVASVRFLETVLLNRGLLNGRLFHDIDAARTWLLRN